MSKKKIFAYFQKLSRAFLMPIALLSIASLMLGISSVFLWHEQLREMAPFITNPVIQYFAKLLDTTASVVMSHLPVLYAVSIGYSLADEDKEYAAFGTLVGYLAFLTSMGFLLSINANLAASFPEKAIASILGIKTLDTGILGAILVGIFASIIHNRVHKIQLPMAISFFGGVRFVPIATSVLFVLAGQAFPFAWSSISEGINAAAHAVTNTGVFGPFIYGFGERILIPTGLHQIWNTVIRDTAVSGIYHFPPPYNLIEGSRGAFNAYMATNTLPDGASLSEMVKFLRGGQLPITVFALPAAAYAMYRAADPSKRAGIKALLLTGAFTSIIAGVTEPLEFAFLFAAPLLFLVYAVLCGAAYMLSYILASTLGGTEASILGLAIFGFIRNDSTWWINCLIGIGFSVIFYFLFKWWIVHFDVKTPGRGGDYDESLALAGDLDNANLTDPKVLKAQLIIKALGTKDNIIEVDCCMSRLRVQLHDTRIVNDATLNATGCLGIIKLDERNIQVVYGTTVGMIKDAVKKELIKQQ